MQAAHTSLRLVQPDFDATSAEPELPEGVAGRIGPSGQVTTRSSSVLRLSGIDRRIHPRQSLSLRVRGRRLGDVESARREPFLNLSVCDVSVGGMRARSQTKLSVGEHVTVFFPPHGNDRGRGWDAFGRVVRVLSGEHDDGCEVAVAFDTPMAA